MQIAVLALDGVFDTGLAAVQDTLATAVSLGWEREGAAIGVHVVGVRRGVATAHGLRVPSRAAAALPAPDVVIVPAIGAKTAEALPTALAHADVVLAARRLRAWHDGGSTIAAACTGTFVLAESGLLDGGTATTSWWLGPLFRARYPRVALDDGRMLVTTNRIVTAGAVLAHFDLALWLIRRTSPAVAATTARYLMLDPRSSQSAYAIPDHVRHADPIVERYEGWARANLATGFSLDVAAAAAGASRRTLARRTQAVLGRSPLGYFQQLRVERALHLLRTTRDSVEQIAAQVGYADGVTLRTLLRRRLGRGAAQLRRLDG